MTPQNKIQWFGFALHTIVVYIFGKIGPRLILEMLADGIVCLTKLFLKNKKK
jgi:hypothetical protein